MEEALRAVTPRESLATNVVVLVESALGRLVVVLVVLVNNVVVVVLFDAVDVYAQDDRCEERKVRRLSEQRWRKCGEEVRRRGRWEWRDGTYNRECRRRARPCARGRRTLFGR